MKASSRHGLLKIGEQPPSIQQAISPGYKRRGEGLAPTPFASYATKPLSGIAEALSAVATCYLISHLSLQIFINPHAGYEGIDLIMVTNVLLTIVILQPRPPIEALHANIVSYNRRRVHYN